MLESLGTILQIRVSTTLQVVRAWTLPFAVQCVRWSPDGSMIMLLGKNRIRIMAVDPRTAAHFYSGDQTIDGNMGPDAIFSVEAGAEGLIGGQWINNATICGFTSDHLQAMLYDIETGSVAVIKNTKSNKAFISPSHSYIAFLTKQDGNDFVTILKSCKNVHEDTSEWRVMQEFSAKTSDSSGICWSPDERYLAVWEGMLEYKIQIFSLFGHLQATYAIEADIPTTMLPSALPTNAGSLMSHSAAGLGIRELRWSPSGNFIVAGDYYDRIRLVETREWSECISFDLSSIASSRAQTDSALGWKEPSEWESNASDRTIQSFDPFGLPSVLPSTQGELNRLNPKAGISWLEFNGSGDMLAVRSDNLANTLFVFAIPSSSFDGPPSLLAVINLSCPISQALWRPSKTKSEGTEFHTDELSFMSQTNAIHTWRRTRSEAEDLQIVEAIPIPIDAFAAKHASFSPDGRTLTITSDDNTFCCAMDAVQSNSHSDYSQSHL
ncbi:uncharacterized protein FA14DRAFT_147591 [Meira miltonrushii]|uniref:WD40 repeat-like protein n=1 Tax=Meira miltonrushii TaxID=1280837 RepID=A0A316VDW3_9BASI|nr:uncharacterized protein FA14DRAFT_147591 [Meira miltonrushii]PWN33645.1 hypothetical protein FA14DRAFT_147591 [Meira miltonrushii]